MTSTPRRGGLRKRITDDTFVQVPSKTVNDFTVSYRALGILTFLLEKPDGWDVRAEQIAGEGKTTEDHDSEREGVAAIRTALNELALAGYYRLERIQLRNGKFVMSTAVSKTPVAHWAAQAKVFKGKGGVTLIEQSDESCLVKYPDGTLHPDDDFPPTANTDSDVANTQTGPQFPGAGFPGAGFPATGFPATGNPPPLTREITQEDHPDSVPPSEVRPGDPPEVPDGVAKGSAQTTIDGIDEHIGVKEPTPDELAFGVARAWLDYRAGKNQPVAGRSPLHQLRSLIRPFVDAGFTENEIKYALHGLGEAIPSKAQMQRALDAKRDGRPIGRQNGRTDRRGAAADVNAYWDNRDAVGAAAGESELPGVPVQTTGGAW